jgi:hypothetical protein
VIAGLDARAQGGEIVIRVHDFTLDRVAGIVAHTAQRYPATPELVVSAQLGPEDSGAASLCSLHAQDQISVDIQACQAEPLFMSCIHRVMFVAIAVTAIGCSASKPKQANDIDSSPVVADPTDPQPSDDPIDSPEPSDTPAAPKPKAQPASDDYEITYRDCAALGQAYGRAWLGDEMTKLNDKKLKQKQFDSVAAKLQEDSVGMAEQYQGECDKTVGTAYLRTRLACALKAKHMARFNDCMDGKVE